jgi:two-component system, LytTR family, response regulator
MQHIALTVDDDQHTRLFMQQVLSGLKLQVMQAEDGAQAIDILQQTTPHVLFLDLLLPEVSGLEVLDFVSQTPRLNDMFIAVVSAHNHAQHASPLDRADLYLVKPVRLQVIRDIVHQAVSRQVTR